MDINIQKNQELLSQRLKNDFRKRISESANEHIKNNEQIRSKRKENPYLEEQFRYKIGDRVYKDYKGIDIIEGKILKVSRLDEICDTSEDILYSAFLQKVESEDEKESITLQSIPKGFPILFTLKTRLEKAVETQNQEQVEKILQLISDIPKDSLNVNEMQYIGGIDESGNIYRDVQICSEQIKQQIKNQKENYKNTIKEELSIV